MTLVVSPTGGLIFKYKYRAWCLFFFGVKCSSVWYATSRIRRHLLFLHLANSSLIELYHCVFLVNCFRDLEVSEISFNAFQPFLPSFSYAVCFVRDDERSASKVSRFFYDANFLCFWCSSMCFWRSSLYFSSRHSVGRFSPLKTTSPMLRPLKYRARSIKARTQIYSDNN